MLQDIFPRISLRRRTSTTQVARRREGTKAAPTGRGFLRCRIEALAGFSAALGLPVVVDRSDRTAVTDFLGDDARADDSAERSDRLDAQGRIAKLRAAVVNGARNRVAQNDCLVEKLASRRQDAATGADDHGRRSRGPAIGHGG